MKNYEKPLILLNEELAEGVYAGSGQSECWSIKVYNTQKCDQFAVFRVEATHSSVAHISSEQIITIYFNQNIKSAVSDGYTCDFYGNCVNIVRNLHGNSYGSGDNFNFGLTITCDNPMGVDVENYMISCTHSVNVQGGFD